jgi:hypothetical protein
MTAKEKAKKLIASAELLILAEVDYKITASERIGIAKSHAINCCNEVLGYMGTHSGYEFWTKVKQEIEKL